MKRYLTLITIIVASLGLSARQPHQGYRGFLEWGNDIRSEANWGLYNNRETAYYTGVITSHGYQINPVFFVGAGIGMEKCNKIQDWIAPLFVQGRADFKFGNFTPFADVRLGCNLADGAGVYFSPSIGYRFNWGRKVGINLGLGMSLVGYKVEMFQIVEKDGFQFLEHIGNKHNIHPTFSFRIGFDF